MKKPEEKLLKIQQKIEFEKINCFFIDLLRSTFLIHVGTRLLLTRLPTYIEKKKHNAGKRVADVGFVWHPDVLFQPSDISVGKYLSLVT